MGNRAHSLALKGQIQYGVRSVLCYKYKQKTPQNPKSIVELILTQYILEECSPMCNVSGLITGIYKGYTWQDPLGNLPYIYQTCGTHLRSDLQSRLSIS